MAELIDLLDKEEILDVENKIQKALDKEIEHERIAKEQSIANAQASMEQIDKLPNVSRP